MKNRLFSFKLYKDGLRQLSLTGIILCVLTFMSMALPAFIELFEHARYRVIGHVELDINNYSGLLIGLFLFMGIGSFVLPYVMFSFLNKRNASDFYDSLPNSKQCTFVSLALAAVTWIWATIILTMAGFCVACNLLGIKAVLVPSLKLTLMFMLGSLYIAAGTMIGITSTGTFFTGIITSCLVICFPRYLITFFQMLAIESGKIISMTTLPAIFNPQLNLFWNLPLSALFDMSVDSLVVNRVLPYIFTFVLSVVYLAIATVIYIRRKSETAEKSAPNRFMQHIFRCALTFPVISIPCAAAAFGEEDIDFAITLFIISALVYFVYEAITSKSFKSVLKSAPVFLILFAFTAFITFLGVSAGKNIRNYVPKTSDISYVTVINDDMRYTSIITNDVKITDEEAKEYIVNVLVENQKDINENGYVIRFTPGSDYATSLNVCFVMSNGRKVERIIYVLSNERAKIDAFKTESEDYSEAMSRVPSIKEIKSISFGSTYVDSDLSVTEEIEAVLEAYSKDIVKNINNKPDYGNYNIRLNINGEYKGKTWYEFISVDAHTPELYKAFTELASTRQICENMVNAIENSPNPHGYAYLSVMRDNDENYLDFNVYNGGNSDEAKKAFAEVLAILKKGAERFLAGENPDDYYFGNGYFFIENAEIIEDTDGNIVSGDTRGFFLFTKEELSALQDVYDNTLG